MIKDYWHFAGNNARCKCSVNPNKKLTDILMLTHALEKGMSLPNPRKSYGEAKALQLIAGIDRYISKFGYSEKLSVPLSLLISYLGYHKNNNVWNDNLESINNKLVEIIAKFNLNPYNLNKAGDLEFTKESLLSTSKSDFKTLSGNRYAIRNFSKTTIPDCVITEAINIAKKSPSACNRQSYRVHIFKGSQKDEILNLQGGAKGFYDSADVAFLITADLNRYYLKEKNLGYVDASLFSMSLMYALTYLGVGTIPLTLGIGEPKLTEMKHHFQIPENEVPVLLIAAGNYPERLKVAKSERNPNESFVTTH